MAKASHESQQDEIRRLRAQLADADAAVARLTVRVNDLRAELVQALVAMGVPNAEVS